MASTVDRGAAAKKIYQILGSTECNDNYKARLDKIAGEFNTMKRDALVPYAIATDDELEDARDLYEKMLIDVQMESKASTSRIKEATAAVQLYFHRYMINLEEVDLVGYNDEAIKEKLRQQWKWMRNYRVWEANRKVFLYPENYIRPELRDSDFKTPAFETLEQDLMQGEITEDAVERVYKRYLDEYTEVSRLKIAGGYVYDELSSYDTDDKHLVLFGRTKTSPRRYYYRFSNFEDGDSSSVTWDPWKKVDVAIDADRVYPVYAFYRVFVFWATTEKYIEESDAETGTVTVKEADEDNNQEVTSASSTTENTKYRVNIYFSFYNLNEEWTQPQLLDTSIETDGAITNVDLYVENSTKLEAYDDDYENIVIRCKYKYYTLGNNSDIFTAIANKGTATNTVAYSFTSEFVTSAWDSDLSYENNGQEIFDLLFPTEGATLGSDDIVMLNSSDNTIDGPWFSYDYKGGSFLVKPTTPAIHRDYPMDLSVNNVLPNIDDITAAFYDGVNTYYLTADNTYFAFEENGDDTNIAELENTSRWGIFPNNIQDTGIVDAGFNENEVIYLFSGNQYYKYTSYQFNGDDADEGYPKFLDSNTDGFAKTWGEVNTAFKGADDKVYLFNNEAGEYYVKGDSNGPYPTSLSWGFREYNAIVRAAFVYQGYIYLIQKNNFARYSTDDFSSIDTNYPKTGYMSALLIDIGFDPTVAAAVSGISLTDKEVNSAYVHVDGNILYLHNYEHDLGVACDISSGEGGTVTLSDDAKNGTLANYYNAEKDKVFSLRRYIAAEELLEGAKVGLDDFGNAVYSHSLIFYKDDNEQVDFQFLLGASGEEDWDIVLPINAAFIYNDVYYVFSGNQYKKI